MLQPHADPSFSNVGFPPRIGRWRAGGYKHSGIGRAWDVEGIEEYIETKTMA